ncbi:hypothetical protein CDD81_7312 [Ophiocordyceps australis]|uniref:Uncharacterized protein n=1 Tax=Ophiocordyceps australis TaxID=1399860 RepID=A0A2C5Y4U3_9HYPO|nr:hypothetical protein CDD81_7312 [Ophiocordyceps australis]
MEAPCTPSPPALPAVSLALCCAPLVGCVHRLRTSGNCGERKRRSHMAVPASSPLPTASQGQTNRAHMAPGPQNQDAVVDLYRDQDSKHGCFSDASSRPPRIPSPSGLRRVHSGSAHFLNRGRKQDEGRHGPKAVGESSLATSKSPLPSHHVHQQVGRDHQLFRPDSRSPMSFHVPRPRAVQGSRLASLKQPCPRNRPRVLRRHGNGAPNVSAVQALEQHSDSSATMRHQGLDHEEMYAAQPPHAAQVSCGERDSSLQAVFVPRRSPPSASRVSAPEPTQCIAAMAPPAAPSFSERLRSKTQRLRTASADNDCPAIMMPARGYSVSCNEATSCQIGILARPHVASRAPRPPLRKKKSFALPLGWTFVDNQVCLGDAINMDKSASAGL